MRGYVFGILVAAMVALSGCAWLKSALPIAQVMLQDVAEAQAVVDAVESAVDAYFRAKPNPDVQSKIDHQFAAVRYALDAGIRTTRGVKDLSENDITAAYRDFSLAWSELATLLKSEGVTNSFGVVGLSPTTRGVVMRTPYLAARK